MPWLLAQTIARVGRRLTRARLLCRVGLHRWSSNVLREPTFRTAYRVRACSACPARRVDAVPAGGAS